MAEALCEVEFHSVAELLQKGSSASPFDPAEPTLPHVEVRNGSVYDGEPDPTMSDLRDLAAVTYRLDEWGGQLGQLQETVTGSIARLSASVQVLQEKEEGVQVESVSLETCTPLVPHDSLICG